jgi:prolyl-tRNA synthetase
MLMPVLQPADPWKQTGRYEIDELFRLRDRKESELVLAMTHEEAVTTHVARDIRSYRDLPLMLYHLQTKERDEPRPRAGILRTREFTMKDAYSFDRNPEAALKSYQAMYEAYCRIFERLGLTYRAVSADTGAIGGALSHEFQVIADTGEDALVYNPQSDFAANIELAEAVSLLASRAAPSQPLTKVPTPGKSTCADVAQLLSLPLSQTVKSLVLATDTKTDSGDTTVTVYLLLVRGDHDLNEVKAGKVPGLKDGFRFASTAEIERHFGCKPGYLGPVGLKEKVVVVADRTVANMSDFVSGANEPDFHVTGLNWGRDLPEPDLVADIRNVVEGDPSPDGKGTLAIQRGIEVGHVFYLGTVYSKPLNATYLDEQGKPQLMEMGCYGIGVTRILGAAIEQNHDARGIIWPDAIAPFTVVICPIGADRSADVKAAADKLYDELKALGVDVLLDDRGERPGAMFADWELIGVPQRIVISDRGLKAGTVELQGRREAQASTAPLAEAAALVKERLAA